MNKLKPQTKVDYSAINIGDELQVHILRLASFKSGASKYKRENGISDRNVFKFRYSYNDKEYLKATRIS